MGRMTTAATSIYYPESDGKPMGETGAHIDALIHLREALRDYFRDDPQVYVAGKMLLYYEEGNAAACAALDVFVVQRVAKGKRRTYRLREEGHPLPWSSRSPRGGLGWKIWAPSRRGCGLNRPACGEKRALPSDDSELTPPLGCLRCCREGTASRR